MNSSKKVSVIIPVYNAEAYLDRCVQSAVNQTHQNLQIILVDDGSPDKCPALCDAWAQRDSRIQVIHKSNGGVSAARNDGIDAADGDYVAFIDSDDWIEPETYEKMVEVFERYGDVDFVRCNCIYSNWPNRPERPPLDGDRELADGFYDEARKRREVYPRLLVTDKLNMGVIGSTVRSMFKREFLNMQGIRYEAGVKVNEDLLFSAKAVHRAKAFYCLQDGYYYHWEYNGASVSHSFQMGLTDSLKTALQCFRKELGAAESYDFSEQLERYALFATLKALDQKAVLHSKNEKLRYCREIVRDKQFNTCSVTTALRLKVNWKYKLFAVLVCLKCYRVIAML